MLVEKYHIEEIDISTLTEGSISGMKELLIAEKINYVNPDVDIHAINDRCDALMVISKVILDFHRTSNIEYKELIDSAIKGMLKKVNYLMGDKTRYEYADYMTRKEYIELLKEQNSGIESVGIEIRKKNDAIINVSPLENTPAFKAGLRPGDIILKVDGIPAKDMKLKEIESILRGPAGKSIVLTVLREGWQDTKDFEIVRAFIKTKSVEFKLIEEGIGYVKLKRFLYDTEDQLARALADFETNGVTSLILDLRNNPGGSFKSVINVADLLLPPPEKLVVYIKDRKGEKKELFTSNKRPDYDFPMIVIVNEWSAGAAEILAYLLKDWKRALIVGEPTLGSFTSSTFIPLKDGSAIKLPTAEYFSPNGNNFREGVMPDIILKKQSDIDLPFEFARLLFNKTKGSKSIETLKEIADSLLMTYHN